MFGRGLAVSTHMWQLSAVTRMQSHLQVSQLFQIIDCHQVSAAPATDMKALIRPSHSLALSYNTMVFCC